MASLATYTPLSIDRKHQNGHGESTSQLLLLHLPRLSPTSPALAARLRNLPNHTSRQRCIFTRQHCRRPGRCRFSIDSSCCSSARKCYDFCFLLHQHSRLQPRQFPRPAVPRQSRRFSARRPTPSPPRLRDQTQHPHHLRPACKIRFADGIVKHQWNEQLIGGPEEAD